MSGPVQIGALYRVKVLPSTAECHPKDRTAGKTVLVMSGSGNAFLKKWFNCLMGKSTIWMHQDELEPLTDNDDSFPQQEDDL